MPILREAGVVRSSLFGSVARGEARPESDVDLLVELPGDRDMFDFMDLEEKLGAALGKKVGMLTFRSIHHLLRDRILKSKCRFYEQRSQSPAPAHPGVHPESLRATPRAAASVMHSRLRTARPSGRVTSRFRSFSPVHRNTVHLRTGTGDCKLAVLFLRPSRAHFLPRTDTHGLRRGLTSLALDGLNRAPFLSEQYYGSPDFGGARR